jgi:hypothetical protein
VSHTPTKEPCEAVALLIARMDSNPQEFSFSKGSKWGDILQMVYQRQQDAKNKYVLVALDDRECTMVWDKFVDTSKKLLHQEFIRRILDVAKDKGAKDGN